MYRPDDWDKIIQGGVDWLDKNGFSSSSIDDDYASGYWEGVEKGADAILGALLKPFSLGTPNLDMTAFPEYKVELRCRIIPSDPWLLCESMEIIKTKGKLVFIPEKN